jgi:aryl-alcohol dehydrogenase-like predicted oxidoreductase
MQFRKLGNTDIDVSLICLGTMTWGEQNTEADAHAQLDYALTQGVNFIDTAEMYPIPPKGATQGLTETYIGNWLHQRGNRDKLVLATKVAGPGEMMAYVRGGPRLNRSHIEQAIDASLKRLRTDYVDLYQVHWPARSTNYFGQLGFTAGDDTAADAISETLDALDSLVRAGKVRAIGISNETPWGVAQYLKLADARQRARIVSIQNPYNLLNRSFEIGLAEFAHREQTGLLAYSPLGFGVLSGKYIYGRDARNSRLNLFESYTRYSNQPGLAATTDYVKLADKHAIKPAQMALAFINAQPFVTANIIGATTIAQLVENIASIDIKLDPGIIDGINAIHARNSNPCP